MIKEFLASESYQVVHSDNGLKAVEQIIKQQPDLVILDIMLPGLDGVEVCKRIRDAGFVNSVLMLTAKDDDFTEVSSLNTGADNYLNKPVRPHILLAHIKALLRRNQQTPQKNNESIIRVQDLKINHEAYQLFKGQEEIQLTSGEFQLISLLAKYAANLSAVRAFISNCAALNMTDWIAPLTCVFLPCAKNWMTMYRPIAMSKQFAAKAICWWLNNGLD
jgi:DNA-binding response OmpR family regulator